MRCSSTSCGKEGDGEFCEECGAKMSDEKDTVVNCSGKRKDGALCGSELVPGQRFCKKCGTKVDQSLFTSVSVVCPQCNAVLESDSSFCMECGHSLIQSVTDNLTSAVKTETDTADNKQDKEKEVEVSGAMDQKKNDDSNDSVKKETDLAVDDDNRTQESKGLETPARNLNGSQHSAGGNNLPKTEKQSFGNNETSGMIGISSDRSNSDVKEECAQDMNTEGRNRMDHSGDQNGNVPMEETGKSENKLITSEVFQPSKDNDSERENSANSDNSLSDVEPVDGSGTEDENHESRKVKKENSNLPMSSTNTELSEQLKEVVLGNVSQRNVPTNEETKLDAESSDSESDSECSDSDQSGLTVGSGKGTTEKSEPVSKQTSHRKRNRKNKKNKKRMRKERAAKLKHQEANPSYTVVENNQSLKEDKTSEKRGKVTLSGKPLTEETKEKTGEPGINLTKSANNKPVFGEAKSWGMKDFDNSCQIKTPGGNAGLFSFSKDSGRDSSQGTKNTDLTTKDKNKVFDNNVDVDIGTNVDEPMITRSKQKKIDDEKTAKERKENENKLKTQKAESSKTGTQKPAERMVHVHFHVFVSEEFKFDPAKHKLILRLGKDELGGWDDLSRVFITKRMVSDKVYEMYYNMKVPARLVVFGAAIPYKYCIWKPEKSEKDEPYRWEHYLKNNQAGQDANRVLILRLKHNTMDEWHQYDGFVEKVPTSYREKFFDFLYWRKELMKHAKKSVQLFTASLLRTDSHSAFTLAEVLEQLEFLMVCLKKIYYHDSKCWDKEETFMSDAGTWFLDVMLENIVCPKKDAVETREEKERRVTIATATVYAANSKDIAITDVKKLSNVCKALLMGPPKNKDTCEELKIVEIYFKGKRKQMKEAFVAVARKLAFNSKDPSWLYLMPWIHFLSEACTPFEKPPFDVNHDRKEPVWWGISHLGEDALKYFKGKTESWTIPINSVLQVVEPLFEMDYLLPRTFMTAVELKDLDAVIKSQKIPLEVCLANLTYFLRTTKPRPYFDWQNKKYFGFITTDEKKVEDSIVLLSEKLVAAVYEGEQSHDEWKMRYLLAASLFNESASKPRENTLAACTQILINLVSVYDNLFIKEATGKFEEKEHLTELKKVQMTAVQWMDDWQWKWDIYMSDILQNWNKLVAVEALRSEKVRDFWNEEILRALLYTLEHKVCTTTSMMANFVTIFCQMLDKYKPCMQESLGKAAFKAITQGYAVDYVKFSEHQMQRFGRLLTQMFNTEWEKAVNRNAEEETILIHTINWAPLTHYLKIYRKDQEKKKLLDEVCVGRIVQVVTLIENRFQLICDGNITLSDLNLLSTKDKKFEELAQLVYSEKELPAGYIPKVLQVRQKEMQAFHIQAEQMTVLTSLCQHLENVDRTEVDDVLKKTGNGAKACKVSDFCVPAVVKKVENIENFQPKLCAFDVSQPVLEMLPELQKCNESSVFFSLWGDCCRELRNQCTTLEDVSKRVWQPVRTMWLQIAGLIVTGDINFKDFEKQIGKTFKDNYGQMEVELRTMRIPERKIKQRLDQLKKYRQLETCVKGAKTILKFAREYGLKGDFHQIEVIAQHTENVMEMKSFNDKVMKACDSLKDIEPAKEQCLNTFVRCEQLVKWLQESMKKSGLKELKVFVDLAFMSAGDEPINIARVQCLHSAVTGYAPLIFDLDENCDYKQLLHHCAVVWKDLEANPNLPQQLIDTSRQLQWLKQIKKAHGSVEVTSLMQAEAINANGIFTVGKNAWKKDDRAQKTDDTLLVVADTLKLTVPENEIKRELRNYTFFQLQDLQSRLMLVAGKAGKGNESVDRFTMIFDSITRLSTVYLKLCSSGCVLFKDWTAKFLCNPDRPVCAILEFGHGEGVPQLKGRGSTSEDLKDIIRELANFMENCLEEWLKHIKEKRKSYLHLNYYTVDQLVILQRELVKMGTELEPSHLVYPLLCAVKEDCTPDDLLEAMTAAKEEITVDTNMEDEDTGDSESDDGEMPVYATEDEKKANFVQELVQAGYEEALAMKAFEFVEDKEDVSAGIVWCMDHDDIVMSDDHDRTETENIEPVDEKLTQRPTFSGWSQSQTDIQTMITTNISGLKKQKDDGSAPLIGDLKALWKQFLESITSNIRDYLSLEHLGLILNHLARKSTSELSRTLPPGFKEDQPNLIICPSGDVLMTTLSVYMMDKDQPLPKPDEILLCTNKTTKDEVDIFWRRAIFDGGGKIHCLMNADMLDYDVSEAAERCLDEYLQEVQKDLGYRLLIICGSDNEYKSTIVSSLDKYKRQPLPTSTAQLQNYLSVKLIIQPQIISGVKPAAHVDWERSSVRVIKSWRAGVGKTLYKQRREDKLSRLNKGNVISEPVSIPLQEKTIDLHNVIQRLLKHTTHPGEVAARLFHIDVSHEVENGVDYLLFNLLILGCLMDKTGFVWRKSPTDIYLIETMPLMMQTTNRRGEGLQYVHPMLNILPDLTCRSPQESLQIYMGIPLQEHKDSDQLFDEKQFRSPVFQRTFQYLLRLDQGRQLDDVHPQAPEGNPQTCLQTLLRHCGLEDPSWSELHHFVWFLNTQLVDFENNMFVSAAAAEDLPGFSKFVLRFLIQMSRDFSTRSLDMREESPGLRIERRERNRLMEVDKNDDDDTEEHEDVLQAYQMRRTWESSPHPYLFFNSDRFSFTFLGFFIDRASGNLVDQQTRTILERGIMAPNLYDSLVRNHAPIQENFDALPRHEKIMKLCKCMGIDMPHDPDDTYELTTDNVKKIMAIYMRFRCDIPVIIMGETGCGKTRLVKFMCALQQPPGVEITNMILMKVHGGTTNKDIIRKVTEAEDIAQKNRDEYGDHMYTVLFFDEANTTEAIGLIKEIMCDKSMEGKKLKLCENLKMVAACNPYRKHSEELIKKLEQAGLGYHVDADETTDRLGRVPMRRLVYRVQPLPQSLLPLVWDFGQLNTQVEDLYIRQMVKRYIRESKLPNLPGLIEVVSAILTASQDYMREQRDECSFVSLRDVDRVLTVMSWFYQQSQGDSTLFSLMNKKLQAHDGIDYSSEDEEEIEEEMYFEIRETDDLEDITRSLILALGVCYHACLKTRPEYRSHVARYFRAPCQLHGGEDQIRKEIESCQEVFLDNVHLEKNIARNMALKENVFMMVVCIELRIPLFLVGKPGSSKSLAKTIVSDAMQGNAAREELFKELKQAQMVSFQCSPLSTPDGIVGTFRQCAQFQKDKDLDTFVSIVVLDEVGLAEDSPRMPLKTLHPLLEDGCQGDEKPEKHMKVAFIGISNWALDPAKMNRGILVQREVPDLVELKNSANGICQTDDNLSNLIEPLIEPMAASYLEIFDKASQNMREFYGLRDFYSLVKMVYSFVEKSKQKPTWHEMLHAIKRNFGGLDKVYPVGSFQEHLTGIVHFDKEPKPTDPDCSPAGLVQACLFDTNQMQSESRYLLLLTENYGALTIIQQQILSRSSDIRPITIFGSSFRSDQEYTQVCRNINKIKVCMETGKTVVLLNLENLYESLYDALNQYYVYFGGERFVDLGLGTHRVKCPVHKNFRLIVVAEKQTVYKKFPIPLINRLEKHFLSINTMLSPEQQKVVKTLEDWAHRFVSQRNTTSFLPGFRKDKSDAKVGDVFIGYHDDTCSAIVLDVWQKHIHIDNERDRDTQVLQDAKSVLLWCATPESLFRLENSVLSKEEKKLLDHCYFKKQTHESFIQYVNVKLGKQQCEQLFAQITTHSKLMAGVHKGEISKATGIHMEKILLLETLSSFDTEQQFSSRIQQHIQSAGKDPSLMIIQCDSGNVNANLIACARYCVMDEFEKMREELQAPVHVVFIVQLPRGALFTGFQCGIWHSAHIDDLYTADMNMPTLQDMQGKSVATIFTNAVTEPVKMEIEDGVSGQNDHEIEEMEWSGNEDGHMSPRECRSKEFDGTVVPGTEYMMREEPLQLDDVLLDLQSVDNHQNLTQGEYGQRKINVKGLILACVQAALSMVKDKVEHKTKETERVSMKDRVEYKSKELDRVALVLELVHQEQVEGQASFLHGVCCLIAKLLKEKESKKQSDSIAHNWLINEAASSENINKAGTFRQSCFQTLEAKIAPILAGIIAYLDTNDNMKILQEHCLWKQELWLKVLNTADAINLQFADLQSPKRQSDLLEVVVMTTGCEGHMFSARMPFSWLLINQISEILKLHHPAAESHDHEEGDDNNPKAISAVKVLSEHAIGNITRCISQEQDFAEAVQEYIHDFVCTMYHAGSEQEHQLVCQSVFYVTNQMANDTTENMLLHSLVNVHMAYQKLAPRLTYFRAMNSVWPECSATIISLKEEKPNHFMFEEQEFTFSSLCLLVENLSPKPNDLNNPKGRCHWLNRVHHYRPVVEKVISLHGEDPELYGAHSYQSVQMAKRLWSRVTVVKLFLEHVCAFESEDKIIIKHCLPLWKILGEETDLKEMKSLTNVEKFLKSCNKQAMKEYLGEEVKCSQCESVLEGPPVTLPCKDVLCDQCFDGMKALRETSCAKCHEEFPDDWEPSRQVAENKAVDKLKDYQKRCNTFFMDVVSQLCFANNTAPSHEVVEKLLRYIFFTTRGDQQRTRDLSIFNTGIDPNPVFRSFLLQLLIRTSEENVVANLEQYLKKTAVFIRQDTPDQDQQYVELCLLVIQCLEDMFTQNANRVDVDEVKYASQALHRASQTIGIEELTVEKLYGLASARTGLAITAKHIAYIVLNDVDTRHVDRHVRKLVEAAQILCEDTNVKWIRIYLVKYLCRSYGLDVYQSICRNTIPFLRWINMKDTNRNQVVEVSDRYVVCGEYYTFVREAITKVVLGENVEHLEETLQELRTAGARIEPLLQLAVHREVSSSYLYPKEQRKLTQQVIQTLAQFIENSDSVKDKALMNALVMNQLVPRHLAIIEGENLRLQGIQCLIVHFQCVMSHLNSTGTLLQPLAMMMSNPQAFNNCFLPAMPQDDLEDVKEALLAARRGVRGADQNPVFYRCPNGHPYVIGDCGRPDMVAICKCGAEIGGQGHNLLPTNRLDTGNDNTMTGHILGRAEARGLGPTPERTLTPVYSALVKLLLHMAMYIGAGSNLQGIHILIKPDIEINSVAQYLWAHLNLDLEDLQKALGRSIDDVLLLMHTIVDNVMKIHIAGEQVTAEVSQLTTKDGRRQWETAFCAKFIQAVLRNLENNLKKNNQKLAKDQRLGTDPLLCLLYETDTSAEGEISAALEEIPRVWRFRTPISLQHLKQETEAKISREQHKVLHLFLKEDHHLRALRYIPSILRLHRALFQKYHRKLDKAEASQINIAYLKREAVAGGETVQLLEEFAEAWELVRDSLTQYLCPTELGGTKVSKEYCNRSINDKTPVSVLLPTTKEAGLCSYALLDFLMRKQNDFLDQYLKEANRKSDSISSMSPREVTSAHLISYDPQQDILPLVLANCQYSFEMGKGTKIEYDFAGLERQLMDKFLFSKSKIDVGSFLMIEQMIYRTEFTNAEVFRKLEDKIPQESLSAAVKTQICSEIRSLPDLCTSLDNLDITISFLKSTGGLPEKSLHEFMVKTLQMEYSIHSQKAQQACEFKHAQSLWLLLSVQKSKEMIDHNQHTEATFESVLQEFHEEMPDELLHSYNVYMKKLSIDKLSQLLEVLHEYILLEVAVRQNPDDEDYTETFDRKLGEWLYEYVASMDSPPLDIAILTDFPKDILYRHSVHTWVNSYRMLREKQTGNYQIFL